MNNSKEIVTRILDLHPTTFREVRALERCIDDGNKLVIQSTDAEIKKCLGSGLSVGAYHKDKLVGYSLGYTDEYRFSVFVEKCYTSPTFRNMGIHQGTLGELILNAKKAGIIHAVATVSSINRISLRNFARYGFLCVGSRKNLFGVENERALLACKL
jgi:ribosomal protein S18 acetylase RimI-like enzyme